MPALYSRRKRQRERDEAEGRGESFWTPSFSKRVRTKILYVAEEAGASNWTYVVEKARYLILKDEGESHLSNENFNPDGRFPRLPLNRSRRGDARGR
jgi:hypothetical protein